MAGPGRPGRRMKPRGECLTCGKSLEGKPPDQKFCSYECSVRASQRQPRVCKHCGEQFVPKAYDRVTFCSRECAFAYKREHARPAPEPKRCVICGQMLTAGAWVTCSSECRKERGRRQTREANAARKAVAPKVFTECGKRFVPEYGDKRRAFCSSKCASRRGSRVGKHVYKARMRGAERYEAIDPIDVFTRDKWRCYLCGRKTDRRLRGTQSALAPELEHIVPIARGGTNTYDNVACACHDCNHKKRDMLPEEMGEAVSYQKMLAL